MTKKWLKRVSAAAACVLIVIFGADLAVRWISSADWLRQRAEQEVAGLLHRSVRIKKMSASFMGLKLDGVEISEAGGFEQGTLLKADRIRLRWGLVHLLRGQVRIHSLTWNGGEINVSRAADGTFSWADMFPAKTDEKPAPQETESKLWDLVLRQLAIQRVNLTFDDEKTQSKFSASNFSLSVRRFAFRQEFTARLKADVAYEKDGRVFAVPANFAARVMLQNFDFSKAYAEVTDLSTQYQGALVRLRLRADDFTNPSVQATLLVKNISSDILADFFPQLPAFALSEASLETRLKVHLAEQTVTAEDFSFAMPGLDTQFSGTVRYGENPSALDVRSSFRADFGQLAELFPQWQELYRPQGKLEGEAVWGPDGATAQLTLAQAAAKLAYAGEFSGVSAEITARENAAMNEGSAVGSVKGLLNGEKFEGKLDVQQTPQKIDADVMLHAGRMALPPAAQAKEPAPQEFVDDTRLVEAAPAHWPLPPINVRADIQIGSLDAPYVYGTDIVFRSELTGVTPDLKQTHGDLSLSMGSGEIRDLYRLTNANAITKVLFLSVNIVGKVFNTMNVFAVLDGLGSGLMNMIGVGEKPEEEPEDLVVQTVIGPDGTPVQIMVPYSERKIDGSMAYDKFATHVNFKQGLADVRGGTFVSDTVSFTLDGTTDFNTGKLDLTVQAAPGKHEADGIMPLRLQVGGTVSEPKGSMNLLGSVSSMVTQGLSNNFASRSVKKGLGGLFGLFKKKKEEPAPAAPAEAQPTLPSAPDASAPAAQTQPAAD